MAQPLHRPLGARTGREGVLLATIFSFLSFLPYALILGLVILIHKLGHFVLGRALWGMDEGQDLDFSFIDTSVWTRFVIVLAGPAANFLLGVLLFWGLLTFVGGSAFPLMSPAVGQVIQGSPAAKAGLAAGDQIVAVNGEPVHTWEDLARQTQPRAGQVLGLTVERAGERFEVIMTTRASTGRDVGERTGTVGAIGITRAKGVVDDRLHPVSALVDAAKRTGATIAMVVKALGRVVVGSDSRQTIGSAIFAAQMTGVQIQLESLIWIIFLTAHLSIVLGALTLLPLPFVDGGRLCFLMIELGRGRPVSLAAQRRAQWLAVVLLVALMVFNVYVAFYDEISRLLATL
jgi:regulator of sigma E protease